MRYQIAQPHEYLAITGSGIKTVRITKAAWVWPFQRCARFSVQPHDYAMNLQAMTREKLQFLLPVVLTVGPDVNTRGANSTIQGASAEDEGNEDRGDALVKYAMLLADSDEKQGSTTQYLENIVKGIVEGEIRVLVSSMTMEEIFTEREEFKRRIFRNIQGELDQFGLKIYNANVKELKDAVGSTYFQSLSQKAHEGATNQARIDVAEAQLKGTVGEAHRHGQRDQEIAKIHADTAVAKTERDIERAVAEARLATEKTKLDQEVDIARIQAVRATEAQDEELKKTVQTRRAAAELERLRAIDVVKAEIAKEATQQAADAKAYEVQAQAKADFEKMTRQADAKAYQVQAETKAKTDMMTRNADAAAYSTRVDAEAGNHAALQAADAQLAARLKEAEGLSAMADAYMKMSQAFGGPTGLLNYMMIEKGTFVQLAQANAAAVKGMQPKINVWNTGPDAGTGSGSGAGGGSETAALRNVYQMLPPLMSTIHDQTGISLPEWQFGRMPAANNDSQVANVEAKQHGVNGHK
ncbi:SPFH domain/Band 7 family protein [Microdochium trichocladiopsis]|uniref:SPFH domain/Band 7 family protein n=1 Tax=Microdochium trichocladiopsis TaxID=1682393 RepID=A0A9P8YHI6_9PEZI|nr:SPFH domain/Band 7 family protein [Microdochium trichocladiopsis]KAH7040626.1 SPFH domain/Band 7 family protein [Microdochium trichocladiopsis]